MLDPGPPITLDDIILSREVVAAGDRTALYRRVSRGELVRLAPGAYLDADRWRAVWAEEQHRAVIRASAALHPDRVFGGQSAALIWGCPLFGEPPARPVTLDQAPSGGRSGSTRRSRSTVTPFDSLEVHGVKVTSPARSLVDAARMLPTLPAVVMLDHALSAPRRDEAWPESARTSLVQLLHELNRATHVGRARARRAITSADGASGSVGESVSRLEIARLGFAVPRLQQEFHDADGLIGFTDFWWPEFGVVGEFDGKGKYVRDRYTAGRDAAQIVIEEKFREDRLRGLKLGVVRWGWPEVREPWRLAAKLSSAGVGRAR